MYVVTEFIMLNQGISRCFALQQDDSPVAYTFS